MSESTFLGKIELPAFCPENVTVWWAQVELRLKLVNLKTETDKFRYVTAALPTEVAKHVSDLILTEPADKPFSILKTKILEAYEPTNAAKFRKLLEGCELGDRKPSALLREMRQLAQGRVSDELLRELFFKRLPETVATILVTTDVTNLDRAAEAADKVHDQTFRNSTPVAAVNTTPSEVHAATANTPPSEMQQLRETMSVLINAVKQLSNRQPRSRSHSRSGGNRNFGSRNSSPSRRKYDLCRYHYKFGDDARQCRSWCKKWSQRSNGKSGNDDERQ
jgi:hypothetical protein